MSNMVQTIPLAASAERTTSGSGTAQKVPLGKRIAVLFDATALDTAAGDKLDVYVDFSLDGDKWYNGCHFTQVVGTGLAVTEWAIFDPSNPATTTLNVTSDCASGVVRPSTFGCYIRERHVVTSADTPKFTYSVAAQVQKF